MTNPDLVCWCRLCGAELCLGDVCYRMGLHRICKDCLPTYAKGFFLANLELLL